MTDLSPQAQAVLTSLKEQALALLSKTESPVMLSTPEYRLSEIDASVIRRAIEALPDDLA